MERQKRNQGKRSTSTRPDRDRDRRESKEDAFPRGPRKRLCRLCKEKIDVIDYKDVRKLQRYVTEKGKILSSRLTGNCAKHQRKLVRSIKRARFIALLPFVTA